MVRFLHTADWQLGMTRHYLAGEAEARFRQARIDAIARMAVALRTETDDIEVEVEDWQILNQGGV